jgi:AcrR family transcriptional regulator
MSRPVPSTRERMIISAALLVRERGARATSIDDVLAHSRAPRGSVYHHFPGGRDQLLREATAYAGEFVAGRLTDPDGGDALARLDAFLQGYRADLVASDFRAGCPVVAVAIESREDDTALVDEAASVFARWEDLLAETFTAAGVAAARARELALTVIASVEGALILCRARRDAAPLDAVSADLRTLLQAELAA